MPQLSNLALGCSRGRTASTVIRVSAYCAGLGAGSPLLPSRLHDFGMRGCCTMEQSVLGGVAHLLNFDGSDTMSAAYYAQVCLCGRSMPMGFTHFCFSHLVLLL